MLAWVFFLRREVGRQTGQLEQECSHLWPLVQTIPDRVRLKDTMSRYLACDQEFERVLMSWRTSSGKGSRKPWEPTPRR